MNQFYCTSAQYFILSKCSPTYQTKCFYTPCPQEVSGNELTSIPHLRTLRLGEEMPFLGCMMNCWDLKHCLCPVWAPPTVLYHPLPWLGFPVSCKQGLGKAPWSTFAARVSPSCGLRNSDGLGSGSYWQHFCLSRDVW